MSSEENEDSQRTRWAVRVRAMQTWTSGESLPESPTSSVSRDHSDVPLKNLRLVSHRMGETSGELTSASTQNPVPRSSSQRSELSAVILEDSSGDEDDGNRTTQTSGVHSDPVVPFVTDIDVPGRLVNPSDMQLDVEEDDFGSDELNTEGESQEKYQCSLLYYLCIMYHMGMWPHAAEKENRHSILKRIQKIFYLACSSLSLIMNVRITKYHIMPFLAGSGKLDEFVSVACSLVQIIAKVYFIWLYTAQYSKFVSIIDRFTEMAYTHHSLKKVNKENLIAGILLGVVSILLSLIFCLFWSLSFSLWSMEEVLGLNAYVLGQFGLSWSPKNYNNDSNIMFARFSENATITTKYSLGILGMVINFFGRLQDSVMCDVVLIMAISLYQAMTNFIKNLEIYGHEVTKREKLWAQYEYMKSIASQINELLHFVILIHMYNALAIALFLMKGLSQEMNAVTLLFGSTAAKVILIYCIGSKISYQNKKIKQWTRDLCVDGNTVQIGGRKWNICVLVDEVTDNQIGFGKDEFFIDQKFVLTFFTGVTTLFVMLAEFREKQNN